MRQLILLFTSGLYTGYIPFASGTWGTALAMLLYWPMAGLNRWPSQGGRLWLYALIVAAVTVAGTWASTRAEAMHGKKDPGKIVIDEIAGYFISVFLLPFDWRWLVAAFFVFRLFDVWKPTPIRQLQGIKGGLGVMIDDVLAGAYTCILLHAARLALGYL